MITIRRVLAPTDFSESSVPAVRYAAELATQFGAELTLLHVVQDLTLVVPDVMMPTPVTMPALADMVEGGKAGLVAFVKRLGLEALNPKTEVRMGAPAAEIVTAAADLKVDLLCIGTHGRTGLAHFLLGSVAERIVRHAPCPVLTVRPPVK
ncbi:MAG TPA: universal stress protein [Urbifossiella sp.]|nr:universal stress protein [Urbifossiella sp.]